MDSDLEIERKPWELWGVSRVTWWRWERDGIVTPGIQLGPNTKGWKVSDLKKLLDEKQAASA